MLDDDELNVYRRIVSILVVTVLQFSCRKLSRNCKDFYQST